MVSRHSADEVEQSDCTWKTLLASMEKGSPVQASRFLLWMWFVWMRFESCEGFPPSTVWCWGVDHSSRFPRRISQQGRALCREKAVFEPPGKSSNYLPFWFAEPSVTTRPLVLAVELDRLNVRFVNASPRSQHRPVFDLGQTALSTWLRRSEWALFNFSRFFFCFVLIFSHPLLLLRMCGNNTDNEATLLIRRKRSLTVEL